MNKKVSFTQSPAFLTKVKKEIPVKTTTKSVSSEAIEQRHIKISFKQYIREIKEESSQDDEFGDIPVIPHICLTKENDSRIIDFNKINNSDIDSTLVIVDEDWNAILDLHKDDTITIVDEFDDRWYVSRTLNNQIVFESQEYDLNGKIQFDEFIKILK